MSRITILVEGRDQASHALDGVSGALRRIGEVAGGLLLRDAFNFVVNGLRDMAGEALTAVSSFQTLQIQFEGLVAREMAAQFNASHMVTESMTYMTQATEKQTQALGDLRLEESELHSRMELLDRKIAEQIESFGDASAEVNLSRIQMERYRQELLEVTGQISELSAVGGQMVTVTRQIAGDTRTAGQMLGDAAEPAKALLDWIKEIAITTPFTVESLSSVMAMSMAMGIQSEQAKVLTMAIGNFTAGMGLTSEHMERIIYNFGQMNAMGKISGREIRDLSNSMVPVNDIFALMAEKAGITADEMRDLANTGEVEVQKFFDAFIELANRDFPGAMDRMSRTWQGVTSNIKDFTTSILGLELLGPIVNAFTDRAATALQQLMAPEVREQFGVWGRQLAAMVEVNLPRLGELSDALLRLLDTVLGLFGVDLGEFDLQVFIIQATGAIADFLENATAFVDWLNATLPGAVATAQAAIQPLLDAIGGLLGAVIADGPAFQAAGENIAGTLEKMAGAVGPEIMGNLVGSLNTLRTLWENHGATIISIVQLAFQTIVAVIGGALMLGSALIESILIQINSIFDTFSALLRGNWDEAWRALVGGAATAFMNFMESFNAFVDMILSLVNVTRSQFVATWQGIWDSIRIITLIALLNLITYINTNFTKIKTAITTAIDDWITAFSTSVSRFVYWGEQLILGILTGIENALGEVLAGVKRAANAVAETFAGESKIESPSKVFEYLGRQIMAGLAQGISAGLPAPILEMQQRVVPGLQGGAMTPALAGAGGGRSLTVQVHVDRVDSQIDLESLAQRIVMLWDQRGN